MATITRLDNANALNLGTAWSGGVAPGTGDIATWAGITTNVSTNLGGSVSWGGVALTSAQTSNIVFGGGIAATLTLGTSGIDLSTSGANLLSQGGITLGLGTTTQSWATGTGRTITVQGPITSTAGTLNITGSGTVSLSSVARTGWTGNAVVVQNGVLLSASVNINTALGGAGNTITVQSGGAFLVTGSTAPNVASWTVSGAGNAQQYGAIYLNNTGGASNWNSKYVNIAASNTVVSFNAARTAIIAGTVSGDIILNVVATSFTGGGPFTSVPNTVTVGGWVRLQSINPTTLAELGQGMAVGGAANDVYPFGDATNKVWVESSGSLFMNGTAGEGSTNLTRQYYFEGETTKTTPATGKGYPLYFENDTNAGINCIGGSITSASDRYVKIGGNAGATGRYVQFNGTTLTGGFGFVVFPTDVALRFLTTSDISGWTGSLQSTRVEYQKAPVGAATWNNGATINNTLGSALTLAHSSYSVGSFTFTGSNSMVMGTGSVTTSNSPTFTVSANTLTMPTDIAVATGVVTKAGAGTLVLSGATTGSTGLAWSAGNLTLNNNAAAGPVGATFTTTSTGILDSTTGATLTQTGVNALNANFTWKGTAGLTFGAGNVTTTGDRTITLAATGETETLKFGGGITTTTNTINWNFGGATASAKQRVTLGGANASLSDATAANQHAITAGYFRIENNNGLGAVGVAYTTTWWVGATNLGSQTTKAALELAGVTTPEVKNVNLYNIGPNDDGALIGASGTSVFSGNIEVPNVAGTRIGVKSGATLTLLGSGIYPNLNPTNSGTPLAFTAESGGTLNQNRILGSNVSTVTVTGGSGTVVFSRANTHAGTMTCSAGTTKVTDANATSTGSVLVSAGATLESTVQSQFQSTLSLGTTSSLSRAILKFAA